MEKSVELRLCLFGPDGLRSCFPIAEVSVVGSELECECEGLDVDVDAFATSGLGGLVTRVSGSSL